MSGPRRAARTVLVLVCVAAASHFLLTALPGDAGHARSGFRSLASDEWRSEQGLDASAGRQFVEWLGGAWHGDLGLSAISGVPVRESIASRLPVTLELIICAQLLALSVGVLAAIVSAGRPGRLVDRASPIVSLAMLSVPTYLVAVVLLSVFGARLGWFPVSHFVTLDDGQPVAHLRSLILPVIALALPEIAVYQRTVRAGLASASTQPHIAAAIGRGLSPRRILVRHALPGAMAAPLALLAPTIARSIGGAVVVEQVFAIPGLGRYALDAINARDQPAIVGTVVVAAAIYLAVSVATETAGRRLDPRLAR